MNHTPWVLLDTETNGITPPLYALEIGAQKMRGWLPDGPPFRRLRNHNADIALSVSNCMVSCNTMGNTLFLNEKIL